MANRHWPDNPKVAFDWGGSGVGTWAMTNRGTIAAPIDKHSTAVVITNFMQHFMQISLL
jgi:hypothetical protein